MFGSARKEAIFYLNKILEEILLETENENSKCFTNNKSLIDPHSSRTLQDKRLILDEAIIKDEREKLVW